MGKSSQKFVEEREKEDQSTPLTIVPSAHSWKDYFTMLGQQYTYNYKPTKKI